MSTVGVSVQAERQWSFAHLEIGKLKVVRLDELWVSELRHGPRLEGDVFSVTPLSSFVYSLYIGDTDLYRGRHQFSGCVRHSILWCAWIHSVWLPGEPPLWRQHGVRGRLGGWLRPHHFGSWHGRAEFRGRQWSDLPRNRTDQSPALGPHPRSAFFRPAASPRVVATHRRARSGEKIVEGDDR